MVLIGFQTFYHYLHVTLQSLHFSHLCHVLMFSLGSLQYNLQVTFYALLVLALEGPSLEYSVNMLLTFTLCYDAGPGCLIRSIRNVCNLQVQKTQILDKSNTLID